MDQYPLTSTKWETQDYLTLKIFPKWILNKNNLFFATCFHFNTFIDYTAHTYESVSTYANALHMTCVWLECDMC